MSDDYSRTLNIIGLLFNLAGVLILFRWGMPFRVATHGITSLALEQQDLKAISLDHIYTICGWSGLVLLFLGTALQIVASLLPETKL